MLPLALAVALPGSAATATADFTVDTDSGGSAFSDDQCFYGTMEGTLDGATPITVDDATADDGFLSLREAICLANHQPGADVVALPAGATITLTAVDNYWYGGDGLPAIWSDVTIEGNGATIARDPGAPPFRLFYVAGPFHNLPAGRDGAGCDSGSTTGSSACATPGSLTLVDLTLQGGLAQGGQSGRGGGGAGLGGAIFNQGTLVLYRVHATGNEAHGGDVGLGGFTDPSADWAGGGIYSSASDNPRGTGSGFGGTFDSGRGSAGSSDVAGGGGGAGGTSPGLQFGAAGQAGVDGVTGQGGSGGHGGGFAGTDGGGGAGTGGSYDSNSGGAGGGGGGAFGAAGGLGGPGVNGGGGGGGGVGGGGGPGLSELGRGGQGGFGGGGGEGADASGTGVPGGFGGAGGFGGGGGGGGRSYGAAAGPGGDGGFGGGLGGDGVGNCQPFATCDAGWGGGGAGMGGVVFNHGGTVTVTDSLLVDNTASGGAGHASDGEGNPNNSTGGDGLGGAIFNLNGTVTLLQSTLAGNGVLPGGEGGGAAGGAVYNHFQSNGVGNDILLASTSTVTLENSVLAGSSGAADCKDDTGHGASVNGTDIVQTDDGCGGTQVDPQFADPSSADYHPAAGSPLIDAGDDALAAGIDFDLDGLQRIVDGDLNGTAHVDVGAYEFVPVGLIVLVGPASDTVEAGATYADPGAVTRDSLLGPVDLTAIDTVDTSTLHTATLHYDYTDSGTAEAFPEVTRSVEVIDTTPPVITLNGADPLLWPEGVAFVDPGAVAADFVDGSVDLTGTGTVDVHTPGTYTLTYADTDSSGNVATPVTRSVQVVVDTTAPVVTVPADVTTEATGPTTPVDLGTATATDDVDGAITPAPDPAGPFPVGTTTVTWSATDRAGNTGTATQTVTITDTTPPAVTAPADVTVEATGPTTSVDLGTATAVDLVDGAITPTPDPAGPFPVGDTTVTWSATDAAGNTGTATQTVTVTDTTPPVLTLQGPAHMTVDLHSAYTDQGATATDLVDGDLTDAITISGMVDTGTAGTYTITYNVSDAAGNAANPVTRTVVVKGSAAATGCGCQTTPGGGGGVLGLLLALAALVRRRRR